MRSRWAPGRRIRGIAFLAAFGASQMLTDHAALFAQEPADISAEEFQASAFASLFQEMDYLAALFALDYLFKKYPTDPLLLRYRAITLDRLGRSEEAIAQFQQLLAQRPDHVPTRYFLGLAYEQAGKMDLAMEEFSWVASNSNVREYIDWSLAAWDRAIALATVPVAVPRPVPVRPLPPPTVVPKRWFLAGIVGWEWDSNVTLKPSDKALAKSGDRNADRYLYNLRLGYHLVREPDWKLDLLYTGRQSFHDDSLDDLNFTSQEASLDARRRAAFLNRDITWGARYDGIAGFLEGDLFSFTNRLTLSADTRLTPRTRTVLTNRLSWIDFGPDGSNPPQTSRDGFYEDIGITQYLYTADFQRHLFLTQEYNDTRTRGGNFERRGTTTRIGIHTPVWGTWEADLAVGVRWNRYPRFSSLSSLDLVRRRDADWDIYFGLTHPVTPKITSRLFYRFLKAGNRNDFYEYDRHVTGVQLLF